LLLLGVGFLVGVHQRLDATPHAPSARAPMLRAARAPAAVAEQLRTLFAFPPGVTRIIINIGSNVDPPMPPDEKTAVVAIEPIPATARAIPPHPLVFVIIAAISNAAGFANFYTFNRNGESSSLADLPEDVKTSTHSSKWWARDALRPADVPRVLFVPVLTLSMLLDAVPPHVRVAQLKTDMQGFDFSAVSAAGDALRRAEVVTSEVLCHMELFESNDERTGAAVPHIAFNKNAPPNRFDAEWVGHMERLGYELVHSPCAGYPLEGDAVWRQAGGCEGGCLLPTLSSAPSSVPGA
jgi:hypothetical protein